MTSAPTSAAYASAPVASPPVTVACAPISPIEGLEEPGETAVGHGDRAAGRGLPGRADAGDLLAEAALLLPDHLEAELRQLLLHLLELLADQVARDLHLRRPLGDVNADRGPGRLRRSRRGRLGHDDALRLVALHVGRLQLDVVAAGPLLDRVDVLPDQVG